MKVYVVLKNKEDFLTLIGVFSSKEKVKKFYEVRKYRISDSKGIHIEETKFIKKDYVIKEVNINKEINEGGIVLWEKQDIAREVIKRCLNDDSRY